MVEESSAAPILDGTERAVLPYDHREMCNFESRTSPGYRLIAAALIRYSAEAQEVIPKRWATAKAVLQSLRSNEAAELLQ